MRLLKKWNSLTARVIAFYQQGWYSIAAKLGEETLEFAEQVFGPDHPHVSESFNNLALICYSQAKEAEAAIFEQTLTEHRGKDLWSAYANGSQYLNKLVLLNLAKRKYSQAESYLERALAIKKYSLGQDHSQLSQILGNLADLHKSQGNYAEAECFLKSLRISGNPGLQTEYVAADQIISREFREIRHNREYMRCTGHFPAKLSKSQNTSLIEGVTQNISQVGTFIKTKNWQTFKPNEHVSVAIELPSIFSEHHAPVEMQGPGIVTRVDKENEGIGVQFIKSFKQFKRVGETEFVGEIKYKRLADYLPLVEEMEAAQFSQTYPSGFFLEKFRLDFDNEVIFQFSTNEIDIPEGHGEISDDLLVKDFLQARVIEVHKKKIDNNEGVITIGRSADNDIVLYNKTVSKSHAFLYFACSDSGASVADLRSTNCTFINDEKITPYMIYGLSDGDELSFGPQIKLIYLFSRTFYDFIGSLKQSCRNRMSS